MSAIIELMIAGAKRWLAPRRKRYYKYLVSKSYEVTLDVFVRSDSVSKQRACELVMMPRDEFKAGITSRYVPPAASLRLPAGDLWVFGYGSLMWKPGFAYVEVRAARIGGYHRALCVRSWVYRGTPDAPGLVVGLDRGGSCIGRAFRVPVADKDAVANYLYERELATNVYLPKVVPVRLEDDRRVSALTFIVDRTHAQYAGKLSVEEATEIVRHACGRNGPNTEYILHTVAHLDQLGIDDSLLHEVQALLGARNT